MVDDERCGAVASTSARSRSTSNRQVFIPAYRQSTQPVAASLRWAASPPWHERARSRSSWSGRSPNAGLCGISVQLPGPRLEREHHQRSPCRACRPSRVLLRRFGAARSGWRSLAATTRCCGWTALPSTCSGRAPGDRPARFGPACRSVRRRPGRARPWGRGRLRGARVGGRTPGARRDGLPPSWRRSPTRPTRPPSRARTVATALRSSRRRGRRCCRAGAPAAPASCLATASAPRPTIAGGELSSRRLVEDGPTVFTASTGAFGFAGAASGVFSLVHALMALTPQVVPPLTSCRRPIPAVACAWSRRADRRPDRALVWNSDHGLRNVAVVVDVDLRATA